MKTIKKRSAAQEKKTAKELKGKTTPASGSIWCYKGDVRTDKYLVECKTTKKPYYILCYKTWSKIEHEAISDGLRIPVIRVDLKEGSSESVSLAIVKTVDFRGYTALSSKCTDKMSFRVEKTTIINWINEKITKGRLFVSLAVIPWNEFLEIQSCCN